METVTIPLKLWETVSELILDMSNYYELRQYEKLQKAADLIRNLENSND